jgi:hypothetical protein
MKHTFFLTKFIALSLILCLSNYAQATLKFTLIIPLYNETNEHRRQEYITCLEHNLKHPDIGSIHILYDTDKDDEQNILLNYLKSKNVILTYIKGRPTYGACFDLANERYPHSKIVISNADIYFNETFHQLNNYDLNNKFLAITRWDVLDDGALQLFKQFKQDGSFDDKMSYLSMDVWIFQTPLKQFDNPNFQLGTWACDGYIAYQAYISGLQVLNPCLSIQCCHLHKSKVRHWIPQSIPGAKALINPWCTL